MAGLLPDTVVTAQFLSHYSMPDYFHRLASAIIHSHSHSFAAAISDCMWLRASSGDGFELKHVKMCSQILQP